MKNIALVLFFGLFTLIFTGENACAKSVVVQKKDSFWKIAKNNNVSCAKFIALNRHKLVFPDNPGLIYPDQVFELPESEAVTPSAIKVVSKTQVETLPAFFKKNGRYISAQSVPYPDSPRRLSAIMGPIFALASPILFFGWLAFFGKRKVGLRFVNSILTLLPRRNRKKGFICYSTEEEMFSFVSSEEDFFYKAKSIDEIVKFVRFMYSMEVCSFRIPKKFLKKYLPLNQQQKYEFGHITQNLC